jgi:hypothetical protein
LTPVSLDLGGSHPVHSDRGQGIVDLVELEWLDDRHLRFLWLQPPLEPGTYAAGWGGPHRVSPCKVTPQAMRGLLIKPRASSRRRPNFLNGRIFFKTQDARSDHLSAGAQRPVMPAQILSRAAKESFPRWKDVRRYNTTRLLHGLPFVRSCDHARTICGYRWRNEKSSAR